MSVAKELKRKRAELLGEVEDLVLRIKANNKQASAINQLIAIYDPAHKQSLTLRMEHKQSRQAIPIPPKLKQLQQERSNP